MIELPEWAVPNGVSPELMDFGITLRPSTGAAVQRVNRKGSRFKLTVNLPPMPPEKARIVVARLLAAKNEGLRVPYPLLDPQGSPGAPVVDGAGQTGTTLAVRGLTAGYAVKEGFWLSIVDASGQHYLHTATDAVRAAADGTATFSIAPMLRTPFADGATVNLAVPMVEGFVDGNWGWDIPVNRLTAVQFPLEEAA